MIRYVASFFSGFLRFCVRPRFDYIYVPWTTDGASNIGLGYLGFARDGAPHCSHYRNPQKIEFGNLRVVNSTGSDFFEFL